MVQKSHSVKSAMFDLVGSLGEERVTKESKAITAFASDMSGAAPKRANLVARPDSPSQAREVVLIAGRFGLPLIPVVGKTNMSGLTVPDDGGVILDLSDLKGIHGVDPEEMFVTIEAGVTWGELRDYLEANAPNLRFGYSLAPADSSVVAGCLMDSVLDLSLRHGSAAAWINGVEAVLSNGDYVHTGIGSIVPSNCSRSPLPDLTSLFVNSFGTLGVVTKATLQLWPKPALRETLVVSANDVGSATTAMRALAREDLCDDVLLATWPVDAMLAGGDAHAAAAPSDGPTAFLFVTLSSDHQAILDAKKQAVNVATSIAGPAVALETFRAQHAGAARLMDVPVRFESMLDHEGGGLVWSSAIGPTSGYATMIERGTAKLVEAGFPPFALARTTQGGHSGEVTFALRFDKKDFEQKKVVLEFQPALAEVMTECGFFPCRASNPVVERLKEQFDQGYRKLFLNLRKILDPGAIMNPGRWQISGKWTRESIVLAKPRTEKPDLSGPVFRPKGGGGQGAP